MREFVLINQVGQIVTTIKPVIDFQETDETLIVFDGEKSYKFSKEGFIKKNRLMYFIGERNK